MRHVFFLLAVMTFPWPGSGIDISRAEPGDGLSGLQEMRDFMDVERARESELALLQFDLEKLKVELEKKKVLAAMAEVGMKGNAAVPDQQSGMLPALRYVFIGPSFREAVLSAGGKEFRLKEGGEITGHIVKAIDAGGVKLLSADGRDISIRVGP
jgi:hypothetical protein